MELFKKDISKYSVRGKWILYFMVNLSEFMRENASFFAPSLKTEKIKSTCSCEPTKAVAVLGPRCTKIPRTLNLFLKNTCN